MLLTARERDVLAALGGDRSYVEASAHLGMSINTLRTHVRNIYRKLGVNKLAEALGLMQAIDGEAPPEEA